MKSIFLLIFLSPIFAFAKETLPKETGNLVATDLVEVTRIEPGIHLDIRYATANNFLGRAFYTQPRAFLQRPAAIALQKVHKALAIHGYGLLVTDAYRPWSITKVFWNSATPQQRAEGFVANPINGSRHNRACAVDVTLYNLKTNKEIAMPSEVDEMTERASVNYRGGDAISRQHRDLLRREMEAAGFTVLEKEWWHFDYKNWRQYRIVDKRFEDIK